MLPVLIEILTHSGRNAYYIYSNVRLIKKDMWMHYVTVKQIHILIVKLEQ